MARISREARKIKIKTDLMKKLALDKKTQSYWSDLVNDYLTFWEIKEKLKTEIERKGAMITIKNGSQIFRKKSDAVVELPKIHKRMTDILEVLAINEDEVINPDEEDDI